MDTKISDDEIMKQGEEARRLAEDLVCANPNGGRSEQAVVAEAVAMGTIAALNVRDRHRS